MTMSHRQAAALMADLDAARIAVAGAHADLRTARAELESARADLRRLRDDYVRMQCEQIELRHDVIELEHVVATKLAVQEAELRLLRGGEAPPEP